MVIAAGDRRGRQMSDQELLDEMVTLLLAGHGTTATSLAWVCHRVLGRPDVLGKLRAELRAVAGDGQLEPEHVGRLEYFDAVVKETARLSPVIPQVSRRLQAPTRIGGHDLPAGVVASPCIYLTHRRPDLWPDPARFDPERFIRARPNPYAFLPLRR